MTEFVTQCPKCQTLFKLTADQLAMAHGQVRCGACLAVFKAHTASLPDDQHPPVHRLQPQQAPLSPGVSSNALDPSPSSEPSESSEADAWQEFGADRPANSTNDPDSKAISSTHKAALAQATEASGDELFKDELSKDEFTITPNIQPHSQQSSQPGSKQSPKQRIEPTISEQDLELTAKVLFEQVDEGIHKENTEESHEDRGEQRSKESAKHPSQNDQPQLQDPQHNEALASESASAVVLEDIELVKEPSVADQSVVSNSFIESIEKTQAKEPVTESTLPQADYPAREGAENRDRIMASNTFDPSNLSDHTLDPAQADRDTFSSTPVLLLDSLELDPVTLIQPVQRRGQKGLIYGLLSILLVLALGIQYGLQNFAVLSQNIPLRPSLQYLCQWVGCQLPELKAVTLIKSERFSVRSHPEQDNALILDLIMVNQAPLPQLFPNIGITFTDINEKPKAARVFTPNEYLAGELKGERLIPAQTPIIISIEVADPGADAVNYQLKFYPVAK